MAQTDPDSNYLLLSDLGSDRIYIYKLDKTTGKLTPTAQPWMQPNLEAGPRHFDFHPNGRWVYSLNEAASTLDYLSYDAGSGALTLQQTLSTLPPDLGSAHRGAGCVEDGSHDAGRIPPERKVSVTKSGQARKLY